MFPLTLAASGENVHPAQPATVFKDLPFHPGLFEERNLRRKLLRK